ncbi:MAG: efflux RND transporter periplasmic adaptor subunit [Acidimicrobiia bacterium]
MSGRRRVPSLGRLVRQPWVVMPLVACVAFGGWLVVRDDGGTAPTTDTPTEQVVEATLGTMARTLTAEGTVAAADTADLSFTVSGTVTAVNVVAGQQVPAGTVLASLDSRELEADLAQAEADVAQAEATLSDHEDDDASDAQIAADESALATAQDRLAQAQEDLAGANLVATFDATVVSVDLTVGEELASGGVGGIDATGSDSGSGRSAGDLGSSGTPGSSDGSGSGAHVRLVSTSSYEVELGFDATDVAELAPGQAVVISPAASSGSGVFEFGAGGPVLERSAGGPVGGFGPGSATSGEDEATATDGDGAGGAGLEMGGPGGAAATATGSVTEVGRIADASSGVARFPVTVAFTDDSGSFVAGASVSVEVTVEEVADVVQVPSFAVRSVDGTSTVVVRTGSGDEERTVTTGMRSGSMVQVVSGLSAGEQVVVELPGLSVEVAGQDGGGTGGVPPGIVEMREALAGTARGQG